MPADNRIRFHDDQTPAPPGKPLTSKHPETAICIPKLWSDLASLENNQLPPKAEVFGNWFCSGLENSFEGISKTPNHRKIP